MRARNNVCLTTCIHVLTLSFGNDGRTEQKQGCRTGTQTLNNFEYWYSTLSTGTQLSVLVFTFSTGTQISVLVLTFSTGTQLSVLVLTFSTGTQLSVPVFSILRTLNHFEYRYSTLSTGTQHLLNQKPL